MLSIVSFWTKLSMMFGKLQRAHPTLRGHFAPAYLVEVICLRHIYSLSMYLAHKTLKKTCWGMPEWQSACEKWKDLVQNCNTLSPLHRKIIFVLGRVTVQHYVPPVRILKVKILVLLYSTMYCPCKFFFSVVVQHKVLPVRVLLVTLGCSCKELWNARTSLKYRYYSVTAQHCVPPVRILKVNILVLFYSTMYRL